MNYLLVGVGGGEISHALSSGSRGNGSGLGYVVAPDLAIISGS